MQLQQSARTETSSSQKMIIKIRPILPKDNLAIASVIRQSFIDHKIDHLEGVSLNDPCLDDLYGTYINEAAGYWVLEINGVVRGGVGIAPLVGAEVGYAELQKMYIDKNFIGLGLGKKLIHFALDKAVEYKYKHCYLETLEELGAAMGLYESYGFKLIDHRLGNTGHNSCGICMLKDLSTI